MLVYKELSFVGDKKALDILFSSIYKFYPQKWIKPKVSRMFERYIVAEYIGDEAPHAEVTIYYGEDTWRQGYVKVGNVVPIDKNQLTVEEYNAVLDLFYKDIVVPYSLVHEEINIVGPTSDQFKPLDYITPEALRKLELFCNGANKSTGSSHPCDEERWYDFICQTVDDNMIFDSDTLYKFLCDEDYWGKKEDDFLGVMGHFAWGEDMAAELASEYENYVAILQYYKQHRR